MSKAFNNSNAFAEVFNPAGKFAREVRDKILVLDTETTGKLDDDEIWELGIVNPADGSVVISSLFSPTKELHPEVMAITGMNNSGLEGCKKFAESWDEIFPILDGRVIGAWGSDFDARLIRQTCERYKLEVPRIEWVCLMQLYQDFKRINYRVSLLNACRAMHVTPGVHRAVEDATAAARVLWKMAESKAERGVIADAFTRRGTGKHGLDYDEDDLCLMTADEYLQSSGWRRDDHLISERIVSTWTDPQTGAEMGLNKSIEVERGRHQ